MNQVERDRIAYALAKEYLLQLGIEGVTSELLEKYLHFPEIGSRPSGVQGIYERILVSAQETNMKSKVIGDAIGGIHRLGIVLCDFEPSAVVEKYSGRVNRVLDDIERYLKPKGAIRRTTRSIWPRYCQTILSGARFMAQFDTADEFYEWVGLFDQDDRARPALPMLLGCEIDGLGFALACNLLKELGYVDFAKPDVHVKDIFEGLDLCSPKAKDFQVFKAVVRVAKNVCVTPYNVDKLFWLIGSGYFYDDEQIGKRGRIGSRKKEFITHARERLGLVSD